jgi:hypothetical protein
MAIVTRDHRFLLSVAQAVSAVFEFHYSTMPRPTKSSSPTIMSSKLRCAVSILLNN